ncbi:MAG: hypothetical protein ACOY94_24065 [Bacillota bacterium]
MMGLTLTEAGIVLNLRKGGQKDRSQAADGYYAAVRRLVREKARGYLLDYQTLEIACQDGCLRFTREPGRVAVAWQSRPPRRTSVQLSLGLWLRACVAGASPAGSLLSPRDLPALIVDPRGILLLRVQGLGDWLAIRSLQCDPQQVRVALTRAVRGGGGFVVRSYCEAEIEAGDGGVFVFHLQREGAAITYEGRPVLSSDQRVEVRQFLMPCLRGRDGAPEGGIRPAEMRVFMEAGRRFRQQIRLNRSHDLDITEAFLYDLWAEGSTLLAMSLDRRSWVVQAKELCWYATVLNGSFTITQVTDRRFDLHSYRNSQVILTEHCDERFRDRIASEWELLCGLPVFRRNLDTKFLLQRLKGQRLLVSADFGRTAVVATPEVTAVFRRSKGRTAVVASVWPTVIDNPRALEEAVLSHLAQGDQATTSPESQEYDHLLTAP